MADLRTKVGHGLAKALGIKLDYRNPDGRPKITRGESVFSVATADSYTEEEPSVSDWLYEVTPTKQQALQYVKNLFPFTQWLPRYNLQWFAGDLVAGITIGAVVVPQGMAYAKLAELPVQFGLYSSFMGVLIYWAFATSKDITIGVSLSISLLLALMVAYFYPSPSLSCQPSPEMSFSTQTRWTLRFLATLSPPRFPSYAVQSSASLAWCGWEKCTYYLVLL